MSEDPRTPEDFAGAFDAAAARLCRSLAVSCARPRPWPARVAAAIDAVLEFAAQDPAGADLLLTGAWAHGPEGVARQSRLFDRLAERPPPEDAELAAGEGWIHLPAKGSLGELGASEAP